MKKLYSPFLLGLALITSSPAANIVWVSDANDPATDAANFTGFFPPGSGYTDSGFVTLLQGAGHNVIRFNQPNNQAVALTAAQLAAFETNDLLIVSRAVNSGALQPIQGPQWNTNITKPLIDISAFHARSTRLGWFTTTEGADNTPTLLTAVNPSDPVTDYLFGGVDMNGLATVFPFDELLDRGSTPIAGAPVAGGIIYATGTYLPDSGAAATTANFIVGFPSNTVVRGGADILSGYRMFFAAGSRESSAQPNTIPLYTARETLSATGEDIFLRAVNVALNNGAAPVIDPATPIGFTSEPASATVLQNLPVTFSVSVTGAAPRTLQWQRDIGDGITFTNIPDATTPFSRSQLTLTNVILADEGARFRVEAINPQGTVLSSVATLTVTPDMTPPVPISAASLDGATISICFNELLDNRTIDNSAEDAFNYFINGASLPAMGTVRPDGRSVILTLNEPINTNFVLTIRNVQDRVGNAMSDAGIELPGAYLGLTSASVGAQNPVGSVFSCSSNTFEIAGGGLDLQNLTDQFQFLYRAVSGDFDARVRVSSLVGIGRHESVAKAILTARSSTNANAATVNIFVTPRTPADESIATTFRAEDGGPTTTNVPASTPNGLPNAWMRITRTGDAFKMFRSTDGSTWIELNSTTVALGSSAVVGMAVNSHRNQRLALATFHDFQIIQPPVAPTLLNPNYTGTAFSASFQTQSGVTYEVQYNNDLNTSTWTTFGTFVGDGSVQPISDPGPLPSKRFYRVRTE